MQNSMARRFKYEYIQKSYKKLKNDGAKITIVYDRDIYDDCL